MSQPSRTRGVSARAWRCVAALLALAGGVAACSSSAVGASSNVTVTMTVASSTSLDLSGCASGSTAVSFGTVLPDSMSVTSQDCQVAWGSTNDTSMLLLHQADLRGSALFHAGAGSLDPAFNAGAPARLDLAGSQEARDVALDPSTGGTVVVGTTGASGSERMVIARFTSAGALDTTFNATGYVVAAAVGTLRDVASSVLVQPDGRIVVAGRTSDAVGNDNMLVQRYLTTGALDATFGTGGTLVVAPTTRNDDLRSIVQHPAGGYVATGITDPATPAMAVVRIMSSGQLDTSFGSAGMATAGFAAGAYGEAVVVTPTGRIVAGGATGSGSDYDVAAAAFTPAGAIDTTFGGGSGRVTVAMGPGYDWMYNLAQRPDGSLVLAGYSNDGTVDALAVVSLTKDGALDTSFNGTGTYRQAVGASWSYWEGLVALPDGRVTVAGYDSTVASMIVRRLRRNGTPDPDFGTSGESRISVPGGFAQAMALGEDGRLAVAGGMTGNAQDLAVSLVDSVRVSDFVNGTSDWSTAGTNAFGGCLATVGGSATGGAAVGGWPVAGIGNCTTNLPANWRPVVATASVTGAKVGAITTAGGSGSAALRFGMRAKATQQKGPYAAPLAFVVVAPNA